MAKVIVWIQLEVPDLCWCRNRYLASSGAGIRKVFWWPHHTLMCLQVKVKQNMATNTIYPQGASMANSFPLLYHLNTTTQFHPDTKEFDGYNPISAHYKHIPTHKWWCRHPAKCISVFYFFITYYWTLTDVFSGSDSSLKILCQVIMCSWIFILAICVYFVHHT